tara:strand:- start:41 stop:172 length:132 start_codon:yes stop_codon:yes gene_type:complete
MLLINPYIPAYRIGRYLVDYCGYKKGAKKPLKLLEIVFKIAEQ